MPTGRAIIHRTASAIGTAVPAGTATAGDADGIGRHGLVEGATGIAREAEIDARLRQIANADATNNFMDFFLSSLIAAIRQLHTTQTIWRSGNAATSHQ
jgi:hypothetical protein